MDALDTMIIGSCRLVEFGGRKGHHPAWLKKPLKNCKPKLEKKRNQSQANAWEIEELSN
jgi:hypothetical protein